MVNIFDWFRTAENEAELLRPNLPKSKQQEMLNKLNLYEDSELYWIFISYIVPEEFMRELFFKFGPPIDKHSGVSTIDDWVFWQDVSESFIREFKDYIGLETISAKQKLLNINYMREYKNVMVWKQVTDKFQWNKKTLKEFKDYVDLRILKLNMQTKDEEIYDEIFG